MNGLYRQIRDDVLTLWAAKWDHADVPVFWRSNDLEPLPDPSTANHFFRNEVDFGREATIGFGGGNHANFKAQYGSVILLCFTARAYGDEDVALDLMGDAMGVFRSERLPADPLGNDLSFVGDGSGFGSGPSEDGNWFFRGSMIVFEYRFRG